MDDIVFTYSPGSHGTWHFSRLSSYQVSRGLEKYVLLYMPSDESKGWVVQDQTAGAKGEIIGRPRGLGLQGQHIGLPPLGSWSLWGWSFSLKDCTPEHAPLDIPAHLSLPFASLRYREDGPVAWLDVTMTSVPIVDDLFEDMLDKFKSILRNLSQRPEMVLFIRSDARESAVPAVRHVRRFLAFVEDNGSEFVLVGRGNAIVLHTRSLLGATLLNILKVVQRLFPSPWPETVVSTLEDADAWLRRLESESRSELAARTLHKDQNQPTREPPEALHVDLVPPIALASSHIDVTAALAVASGVAEASNASTKTPAPPSALAPKLPRMPFGSSPDMDSKEAPSDILDPTSAQTRDKTRDGSWFCGACSCGR